MVFALSPSSEMSMTSAVVEPFFLADWDAEVAMPAVSSVSKLLFKMGKNPKS
jgi:hypothetical protein